MVESCAAMVESQTAMSMNIKNEETHRLARELAELAGESLTEAVTQAVRERLERLENEREREALVQRILEIGRDCARHMKEPFLSTDHGDLLYDELGLPK
jgi:antitoxin VapB